MLNDKSKRLADLRSSKEQAHVLSDIKDMIVKLRQDPSLEGQALAEFYDKWYLVKRNLFRIRNG